MTLQAAIAAARASKLDAAATAKLQQELNTAEAVLSTFSENLPWTPATSAESVEVAVRQKRSELIAIALMNFMQWQNTRDSQAIADAVVTYLQEHNMVVYAIGSLQAGSYPVIPAGSGVIGHISYN